MPVRIRLARHGRKSRPFYYIVVADSRAPRDGKFIERIGSYNPITNPATVELDFDKALDWLQKGAQPSDTIRNLLQQKGVMYKNHLLKGVKKGALTEEQAEQKFQEWISEKQKELDGVIQKIKSDIESEEQARHAAESKIRESMAAELARKRSELIVADEESVESDGEPAEGTTEDQPVATEEAPVADEAPDAPVEEAPVEEAKVEEEKPEAPVEEEKKVEEVKAEEPVVEEKKEEEVKAEEPVVEEKKEEEVKAEAPAKEEKKEEKTAEAAKDEAREDKKAEEEKSEK